MSTLALADALAALFVPLGTAGAVLAVGCALLALLALTRGSAGLAAGAVGVWIVGALLSLSASFVGNWLPVLVSLIALGVALIAGGVLRMLWLRRRVPTRRTDAAEAAMPAARDRAVAPTRTGTVRVTA